MASGEDIKEKQLDLHVCYVMEFIFSSQEEVHVFACSLTDMDGLLKKRMTINDRDIVLVRGKDKIYALDSFCYHAGGPLYNGDIEELGGRLCMVCPWHKYKVCLETGQNYYQSVDPYNLKKPPKWTAGDIRQRTHKVIIKNGNIYVILSERDGTLDSDVYNKSLSDGNS